MLSDDVDFLDCAADSFRQTPQTGTPVRVSWSDFASLFRVPVPGDAKNIEGGLVCGVYEGNIRRKTHHRGTNLLPADLDGGAPVDVVAELLASYRCIIHETFTSTPADPRCRIFFKLSSYIDVATFEAVHAPIRAWLRSALGAKVDEGAKDAPRVSYWPVRRPGDNYGFAVTTGKELDAARVIAAQPKPLPRAALTIVAPKHADRYRRGALERAARSLASASDGTRHETLNRECYSLARLGLSEAEIAGVLLPVAVHVMGDARRYEAERTIRDAVRARTGKS